MKKYILFLCILFVFLQVAYANTCKVSLTLVNQDPYPAVPGESVRVLLQMTGVEDPACRDIRINFIDSYPFSLDSETPRTNSIKGGTFVQDYGTHWIIPYKLRVDKNALEGFNEIKVGYVTTAEIIKSFSIKVEEVKTEFEVHLRDYSPSRQSLTIDVINVGKNNVEALVLEIPAQEKVTIKGSNRNIIGILDAKEDTSATFEGILNKSDIDIILRYNDKINERRDVMMNIKFDLDSFVNRKSEIQKTSQTKYIVIGVLVLVIGYFVYRKFLKKNKKKNC